MVTKCFLQVGVDNSEDKKPAEPEELTFWRQVADPKSNSVYYWNPKTNKVSWILPNNGVIADDAPENPLPEEFSMEPEADNPYVEYYAYYKKFYEKTDPEATATETEESDSSQANVPADVMSKTEPKPKKSETEKSETETEPATKTGTVIGPRLPSSPLIQAAESPASRVTEATRPGVKRKFSPVKEADGSNGLDLASKKARLKSKTVDAKSLLSPQAEQALRVCYAFACV